MPATFDALRFARKLLEAGFTREQAETLAELVRDEVVAGSAQLDTFNDLEERIKQQVERAEERMSHKIEQTERSIWIKFGGLLVVAVGALATILNLGKP
jgi:DNA-binding transcriptional MerR regulator